MNYLFEPAMFPFGVALLLMSGIGLLEGVAMVLGSGLSQFIDNLLPDTDLDFDLDMDLDMDAGLDTDLDLAEIGSPSALSRLLGWLCIGHVPILVLFVIFLASFGLMGIALQNTINGITGFYLPTWLASIPVLFASLPIVRVFGKIIGRIIPKDETSAISSKTFRGRVVTITLGTAEKGNPAQAKFTDRFGQSHYLMVEPEKAGEQFQQNDQILLLKKGTNAFIGIRNTNEKLVN